MEITIKECTINGNEGCVEGLHNCCYVCTKHAHCKDSCEEDPSGCSSFLEEHNFSYCRKDEEEMTIDEKAIRESIYKRNNVALAHALYQACSLLISLHGSLIIDGEEFLTAISLFNKFRDFNFDLIRNKRIGTLMLTSADQEFVDLILKGMKK